MGNLFKTVFIVFLLAGLAACGGEKATINHTSGAGGDPTVVSSVPVDGSTTALVSAPFTVTFSNAMNTAVTETAFSITPVVTGTFSWSGDFKTVTYTPTATLPYSTSYSVTISTVATDTDGLTLAVAKNLTFITQLTVNSTQPPNSALNFPWNAPVGITYNESMSLATTEGAFSISPAITGTFSWTGGNTVLSFTPSVDFDWFTAYTVTMSTATLGSSGATLATPYSFGFTTRRQTDCSISHGTPAGAAATYGFPAQFSASSIGFGGNWIQNFSINVPAATYLQTIGLVTLGLPAGPTQGRLALFTDNAGEPGDLIAGCVPKALAVGNNQFTVNNIYLPAGTYWVGINGNAQINLATGSITATQIWTALPFADPWPITLTGATLNTNVSAFQTNVYINGQAQ